jgi:hypothetical protein
MVIAKDRREFDGLSGCSRDDRQAGEERIVSGSSLLKKPKEGVSFR